jgi:hypothetical protein
MGYKEWTAIIQLAGAAAVGLWLAMEAFGAGLGDGTPAGLAIRLLWAVGGLIAINVIGMVIISVVLTVIRQKEFTDEPADERDDMIDARSSRIGYAVTSSLAALTLIPVAMGGAPTLAITMLFVAPLAGGIAHAAAQLVFYRLG